MTLIAGTMLLVTALFNFLLSKKPKAMSPKRPQECSSEQTLATVCITEQTDTSFSLLNLVWGRKEDRLSLANRDHLDSSERRDSAQAMLELQLRNEVTERRKKMDRIFFRSRKEEPVEREMDEMGGSCDPEIDTTSDTAPMIAV